MRENGCVLRFHIVTDPVSSGMHRGKFNNQLIIISFAEILFLLACLKWAKCNHSDEMACLQDRMQRCKSKCSGHKI